MSKASGEYTREEVAKHNTPTDAWIIIGKSVYDVSKFARFHPGGVKVLQGAAGQDATADFHQVHGDEVMRKYHKRLCIGKVVGDKERPLSKKEQMIQMMAASADVPNIYGDLVPYGDPAWYQGWESPYYTDSHRKFRDLVRNYVEREVEPFAHRWDEQKKIPKTFLKKCAESGCLPIVVGTPWPSEYTTYPVIGGMNPEELDMFHELIFLDEVSRTGSGGILWGLCGGLSIGLPPVLHFGSDDLKKRIVPGCLAGDKVICLAITEPWGGSDVANLRTTAKKTADGKHYIVNGEKKWITNGVFADYFTVAVRTGGPGMKGVSMLLIERSEGMTTKQMNCMGVWASGTTYITFEDVLVPVENLIGKENKGFQYIMHNFNHERWGIIAQSNRFARVCLEESVKWATKRRAFGKTLIQQPVIRAKIAEMARQVFATHSALEYLTYQFDKMPKMLQPMQLGGPTALLKLQATKTFEFCAREAAQIFGGASYTRGGPGVKVERLYREVRAYAIPGGSEEIMADLGVRQALKVAKISKMFKKGESKL